MCRQIHGGEIGADRIAIGFLRPDPTSLPDPSSRRMRVGDGQRLIGEPGIGNEAAGSGGAHHVATPKGIDTENHVSYEFLKTFTHYCSSLAELERHHK